MLKIESKYKLKLIIPAIILVAAIFSLSGCGGECKKDSDCAAGSCFNVKCADKKCVKTAIPDCCGNKKCEEGENKCSCEEDCEKCAGAPKVMSGSREKDAKYLEYLCISRECVLSVGKESVKETRLIDEKELSFFTLETAVAFNQPFNIGKDSFRFRISLKDAKDDLVYPVKISSIKLLSGETLLGETFLTSQFDAVGDTIETEFPVAYQAAGLEEEKYVSFKLDYEYAKKVKEITAEGAVYTDKTVRDSYENRFKSKLFFLNP